MDAKEIVVASLKQSRAYLERALDGLSQEDIAWRPSEECNCIAFIAWHTARVEDFFISRVIQRQGQVYETQGWQEKLGTPDDSGFGYSVEQLKEWPVPKLADLVGYVDAVRANTSSLLDGLTPEKMLELARPDRPPDTIGAVFSRIITETALHMGQIDYIRGIHLGFVTTHGV
jgi:hypothetical protein